MPKFCENQNEVSHLHDEIGRALDDPAKSDALADEDSKLVGG